MPRGRYPAVRRRRASPAAASVAPARPTSDAGIPVRGSSPAAADDEGDDDDAGAVDAAGVAVAACVVAAGAVVAFFVVFFGVVGAARGSWYWSSPAPSANAVAGTVASSAVTSIVVSPLRVIASLVADRF